MTMALRLVACGLAAVCAWHAARASVLRVAAVRRRGRQVSLDDVLQDRVLCPVLFSAVACTLAFALSPTLLPACLAAALLLSRRMPELLLRRRRRELRSACDGQLDVLADIVSMGMRAGLSFDAALGLFCRKFDTPLAREMDAVLARYRSGIATRDEAFSVLYERTGSKACRRFGDMATQAIAYGSPLAAMLSRLAEDLRKERHAIIERQVAKAPVKMLVPTGTCILPAMLLLVMGPALVQFVGMGV